MPNVRTEGSGSSSRPGCAFAPGETAKAFAIGYALCMSLWRSIVQGFGFTIGARAADEALSNVEHALDEREAAQPTEAERAARANAEAKVTAKRVKERAAAAKRREREIEAELKALKKKVAKT